MGRFMKSDWAAGTPGLPKLPVSVADHARPKGNRKAPVPGARPGDGSDRDLFQLGERIFCTGTRLAFPRSSLHTVVKLPAFVDCRIRGERSLQLPPPLELQRCSIRSGRVLAPAVVSGLEPLEEGDAPGLAREETQAAVDDCPGPQSESGHAATHWADPNASFVRS